VWYCTWPTLLPSYLLKKTEMKLLCGVTEFKDLSGELFMKIVLFM
jgi:hypothetical protein